MRSAVGFFATFLFLVTGAVAENWPHWRGPSRDGVSTEKNLPTTWTSSEGIAWKIPMAAWSGATPIIWGDRIFLNSAEGGERVAQRRGRRRGGRQRGQASGQRRRAQPAASSSSTGNPVPPQDPESKELSLWCIDRNNGELIWKRSMGGGNQQVRKQNMSSPSPVTDGRHVWAMTGTGVLKSFDFDGNEMWNRDIQADYGRFGLNWGYASSPLLYDGTLYVQVLHGMKTDDPSYLLGIDALSGATRWRVERPTDAQRESPDSYTTPALLQYDGKTEVVVSGGDYVTGHHPSTGKELWRAGGLNPGNSGNYRIIASPMILEDMIYVPSRRNPLQVFRAGGSGDITESHRLWQTPDGPDVPTPVSDGKYLYVLRDNGVMFCRDARTGEVLWGPERVRPGTYSASPVLADGKIYVTSEDGVVSVVAADSEFRLLAENELEGYTLASPAISEGQMFIRTEAYLYCIGQRAMKSASDR